MRKLLLFGLLFSIQLFSQTTVIQRPDCVLPLGLLTVQSSGTSAGPLDNRVTGCNSWILDYSSSGFTVVSLLVQVAPDAGGVPGAWATFTAVTGINPNTSTTQAVTTFGGATSFFPWLRVQLTTATGTGQISGILYGWKVPPSPPPGTNGCVGTAVTPCVVDGPNAAGTAATFPPVLQAGQDGAPGLVRVIQTDTTGRQIVVGAAASGAAAAGNPVLIAGFDGTNALSVRSGTGAESFATASSSLGFIKVMPWVGDVTGAAGAVRQLASIGGFAAAQVTNSNAGSFLGVGGISYNSALGNWDIPFNCASQVRVTLTDATLTALVAVSGATRVRVCHAHATTSGAAQTVTFSQGTGVACAGAPVTLDSYLNTLAFSTDYMNTGAMRTAASNGLCVQQSGAAQNTSVFITYAQY